MKTLSGSAYDRAIAIAERCKKARQRGKHWQACCPAHDDHNPSLSITYDDAKGVGLKCHKGCSTEAIVAALGLAMSDLFVQQGYPNGHRRILRVFDYYDADGTLVHQTVRYDDPEHRFGQRRPDPVNPGEYVWNLQGVTTVLYNLPVVLAAIQRGDPIHLTEGERDAETLTALGLVATSVPMGAKHWRDDYTMTLTGADVIVWPDNDETG